MEPYTHQVQYYETDKMAITHHSNYVRWMEEARVDFLRQIGWDLEKLEAVGYASPVAKLECRYRETTVFGEKIQIQVFAEPFNGVRLKLRYVMKNQDGRIVCDGWSEHCFTNQDGAIVRIKKEVPEFYEAICAVAESSAASGVVTGIIGAMESEVRTLQSEMKHVTRQTIAGMEFCEGRLGGAPCVVVQSGMGKVNAGICAQILITHFGVDRVINTGVAGGLDPGLKTGDFVIATDAVQHDFDVSPIGFVKGEIPYTGKFYFTANEVMQEEAKAAAEWILQEDDSILSKGHARKILNGRVCSGDQFIASLQQKDAITSQFGGLCCEMEGGAIAHVCDLNEIPFVIIRAISDDASDEGAVSFEQFQEEAARECAAIVRKMVEEA